MEQLEVTNCDLKLGWSEVQAKCVYGTRCCHTFEYSEQQDSFEVNIRIIRVFTKMREFALTHKDILLQLNKLEKEVKGNTKDIENIFLVLKELIEKQHLPAVPKRKIGFRRNSEADED